MFELPQESKESSSKGLWIGIAVVVVLAVAGTLFYVKSSRNAKTAKAPLTAPVARPVVVNGDPIHDLKILDAKMGRDPSGTMALWVVVIENKSTAYTYSDIQYETTYFGANDKPLLQNKGTISVSINPGEEKDVPEFRDALYPSGTAYYRLKITNATATTQ